MALPSHRPGEGLAGATSAPAYAAASDLAKRRFGLR
jgi:hypothetical protein